MNTIHQVTTASFGRDGVTRGALARCASHQPRGAPPRSDLSKSAATAIVAPSMLVDLSASLCRDCVERRQNEARETNPRRDTRVRKRTFEWRALRPAGSGPAWRVGCGGHGRREPVGKTYRSSEIRRILFQKTPDILISRKSQNSRPPQTGLGAQSWPTLRTELSVRLETIRLNR